MNKAQPSKNRVNALDERCIDGSLRQRHLAGRRLFQSAEENAWYHSHLTPLFLAGAHSIKPLSIVNREIGGYENRLRYIYPLAEISPVSAVVRPVLLATGFRLSI